jgi:ubiquinone biosynthesis protein UbiJ
VELLLFIEATKLIKIFLAKFLELTINNLLQLDSSHLAFLQQHAGKVINIEISDLNQSFYIVLTPNRFHFFSMHSNLPNVVIRGKLTLFLQQMLASHANHSLQVEGDVELAQDLQRLIKGLDLNWEELLAPFIGDFTVHHLSALRQRLKSSLIHTKQRTAEDLLGYLQEEKCLLPPPEQIEDFYEEIGAIRFRLDRLEARMQRLMETNS